MWQQKKSLTISVLSEKHVQRIIRKAALHNNQNINNPCGPADGSVSQLNTPALVSHTIQFMSEPVAYE